MKRIMALTAYVFILWLLTGCHGRQYTLTIVNTRTDGKTGKKVHTISAGTDSLAYAEAAKLYFLSLHAYRMMSDNAKPFISRPVNFILTDETGKRVDSIIGLQKADVIRKKLDTLVN